MRKRIYRISEDKFDDLKPDIVFEKDRLEEICYLEEDFLGTFSFESTNDYAARGLVYCTCPYVTIDEPRFDAQSVTVTYRLKNIHCKLKEKIEGEFIVIAVGVEQTIPFSITYEKRPLITSVGQIDTLADFADFAQARFTEAVSLFYSDKFEQFLQDFDSHTKTLYRGFRGLGLSPVNVDEFLVACGLKDTMTFDLRERHEDYYGVEGNLRGQVEINRSTWGFIDIEVSSDADFVSVEKEHITADFFLGSVFSMNYYIHREKMHAGKNYARISFDFRGIHKEITIMATACQEGVVTDYPIHDRNCLILKACRCYEDFRLKRMTTGQWCGDTLDILEKLNTPELDDNFILLCRALVFITNKQKQEALWLITDLKRTIEDKHSMEWAFLLYLCTLIEREESYVDRITEDIEHIFLEHPDDVRIFWFLLFLRRNYIDNPADKLKDISQWILGGFNSPVLYIEAYYTFLQDPYLLKDFDNFVLIIMNWARKHQAITQDLAIQTIHVLEGQKVYKKEVMPFLEACYQVYPDLELLMAIVTYILKAPNVEESFLPWFSLAIEANLHVAGLFEAYMNCLPENYSGKLPQLLTMYFSYNNALSFEKKALLYASVILHAKEDPDTYEQYQEIIESFAVEQLKLGRLNDNLAVCYQLLLEKGIFDSKVAGLMASLMEKKKLIVLYSDIKRAIIYQDQYRDAIVATIKDAQAIVSKVGNNPVIFLEDTDGHVFVDGSACMLQEIIEERGQIDSLRQLAPQSFEQDLDLIKVGQKGDFSQQELDLGIRLIDRENISYSCRNSLYPRVIDLACHYNREMDLLPHFMEKADLTSLSADLLGRVLDIFAYCDKLEEAYYMLTNVNGCQVSLKSLEKMCTYRLGQEADCDDDFLISCCAYLAREGHANREIITYLTKNYVGPTDTMMSIFKQAFDEGLDTVDFAERIIIQNLYRDFLCQDIMYVFDKYMARRTNKMVEEAFLTYEARAYLTKKEDIAGSIFSYIYSRYRRGDRVNETMRIALLKHLCLSENLDAQDLDMLDMLLADAIIRNQYFGFFANCPDKLKIKYHLYDKQFVELEYKSHSTVNIRYSLNGSEFRSEEMIEMYDGLYVKQFILFFSDQLDYEIYAEDSTEILSSDRLVMSNDYGDSREGRYALMNDLIRHRIYQEKGPLATELKNYQGLSLVTRDLFTII